MIVEAEIAIKATRAAAWNAMTDIANAASIVSGIDAIEVIEQPSAGLVGLRWRETRMLFGKPATVEKWVSEAVENTMFRTKAETGGFVFVTTTSIAERDGNLMLTSAHDSQPQTFVGKLQTIPMSLFFKGIIKKAILQDLNDIKAAVEKA